MAATAALLAFAGAAHGASGMTYYSASSPADPVTVAYYTSGYTDTGTSITFTGSPVSVDQISSISELRDYYAGQDSDPNWPSAANPFGADFTAEVDAPTSGTYTFAFGVDDGGYLLVDGSLVANQGGTHAIDIQNYTVTLSAGLHSLEVQYDNVLCCGAIAYVGLNGAPAPAPEPASWSLLITGIGGMGATLRATRRRGRAARA
jgi:hypothetical protein